MNDNNNNNDDTITKDVMNAIQCLKTTLLKHFKKYGNDKYNNQNNVIPNDINTILLQMKYCLCILKKQIISLQCLIQCLMKRLHPILIQQMIIILNNKTNDTTTTTTNNNNNNNSKKQKLVSQLFQILFLQIIRIQDSIILCVSGECRHQGNKDIVQKQRKQFPYIISKLGTTAVAVTNNHNHNNHNNNESSILYNPNHIYSGTSWDEYMDHHVGIKTRLIEVLQSYTTKKKNNSMTWDTLHENGTILLENIINDIEIQMKYCKDIFIKYCKQQLINDIKYTIIQNFHNTISFHMDIILTDKLEKMNIKMMEQQNNNNNNNDNNNNNHFQLICSLERYGNQFQINDIYGVLPLHYITIDHWFNDNTMKIPIIINNDKNELNHNNNIINNKNSTMIITTNSKHEKKTFKRLRRRAIEDTDSDNNSNNSDSDQNLFDTSNNDNNNNINNNSKNDQNNIKSNSKSNHVPDNNSNNIIKDNNTNNDVSNGLVVKFQKHQQDDERIITTTTTKSNIDVSVNAIKEQLGIDTKALEISRENLEAEENEQEELFNHNKEIDTDDDDNDNDNIDTYILKRKYRINNGMIHMKQLQKVLKKYEMNYSGDITMIWDARESLREVVMEIGNLLLWSKKHDTHNEYYDPMSHTNSCNYNQKNNSIIKCNNNNNNNEDNNNNQYYYSTIRDWMIQSIKHFYFAKELVMEQQKQLHNTYNQKMISSQQQVVRTIQCQMDDNSIENSFLERNLLLLKGRAITNAGIGYIELFTIASYNIDVSNHISSIITDTIRKRSSNSIDQKNKILLVQAIECFNEAVKDAEELQRKCQNELLEKSNINDNKFMRHNTANSSAHNNNQGKKNKKNVFEVQIDLWKGKELMSLTHRWNAIALWYLSKFNDSYNQFHLASSCCCFRQEDDKNNNQKVENQINSNDKDDETEVEVNHAKLDCQIECYYAWTQLSDLCINSLQRGTVNLIRTNTKRYDTIFEYVTNGLHLASNMSTLIYQLFKKLNINKDHYHIKSSTELLKGLDEIIVWWKQKKSCALKQLSSNTNATTTTVIPMDIGRNDLGEIPKLPTKLYTFYEGSSSLYRQRSKNGTAIVRKNRNRNNNVNGNMSNKENSTNHDVVQKQRYRKWGDQLLPHQEIDPITGIMKPKLIYPSIAPTIPDDMKLLYEQYLERKKQKIG